MPETGTDSRQDFESPRIVVGIDGARGSRQALQRAVEVFGSHCVFALVNVIGVGAFTAERRAQSRLLASTLDRLEGAGIKADVHAREGSAAEMLVEVAASVEASVLVVGSRGAYVYVAGRGDEGVLGSVCSDVLSRASCDVFVVKEKVGD